MRRLQAGQEEGNRWPSPLSGPHQGKGHQQGRRSVQVHSEFVFHKKPRNFFMKGEFDLWYIYPLSSQVALEHFLILDPFNPIFRAKMPELAEVVDGQPEEVDEGVGEEVHSEESGDDNDSIPDLEETEAVADGEVAANGAGTLWFSLNGKMFFNFNISR